MAVNKVEYAGMVLLDLTEDSVVEGALLPGYTAHDKSGRKITGTLGTDKFVSGTITQKDTSKMEIDTGLDRIKGMIVYTSSEANKTNTIGFIYTEFGQRTFIRNYSTYIGKIYYLQHADSITTIEKGLFSAVPYDTSYPFATYVNYNWIAWGDTADEEDRDVYSSGTFIPNSETKEMEINTGLDTVNGLIVLYEDTATTGIKSCIYSSILKMQSMRESVATEYAYANENLFTVDGGIVTISENNSQYGFIDNAVYNWIAWGDGTVKIGDSTSNGGSTNVSLQKKTATPSETEQVITPDSGYDGLSQVTIGAIDKTYIGSGVTKKSAQTYTPGTTNQTIAAGQYLSGAQTIKGDANLKAANIKKGVSIFNVAGTYEAVSGGGNTDNNCEAYLVDVTDPTVSFKRTDGTIKAWGYAYLTSSSGWSTTTTVYAFAGDKYYKSAVYGSPTATNLTLSVSDGKLTGLPTLTGGELLITKGI